MAALTDGNSRFVLHRGGVVVGHDRGCDFQLTDDSVAAEHVRIGCDDEGWFVEDLGSVDGTFVNDVRVGWSALRDGDVLRIGRVRLEFVGGPVMVTAFGDGDPDSGAPPHSFIARTPN